MMFAVRLLLLFVSILSAEAHAAAKPKKVRRACEKIFQTAFPPQQWTSVSDLKAFSKMVAVDQPTFFACPAGGSGHLRNFTKDDLMKWFLVNFNPADFKYTEYVWSDVMVAGNVCSFDKLFFAEVGDDCQFQAVSRLIMEVDAKHDTLIQWVDHFDEDELTSKLGTCLATPSPTMTPSDAPTPGPTPLPTPATLDPTTSPTLEPTPFPSVKSTDSPTAVAVPPNATTAVNRETLEEPDELIVRQHCVDIFETAFPPQRWTTEKDLKAFSKLVAPDEHNYFACPQGGAPPLMNFSSSDLFDWFKTNFDPNAFKYTEYIMSDVFVAGNVCSFDKLFFAAVGDDCQFPAKSMLLMEVTDDGQLLKWSDSFDEEDVNTKFTKCLKKLKKAEKKKKKKKGKNKMRVEMEGMSRFGGQVYQSRESSVPAPFLGVVIAGFASLSVAWYRRAHQMPGTSSIGGALVHDETEPPNYGSSM